MTPRDVPEPWASAMERRGFTDPRSGRASMRALADAVGSTTTTISEMIYATRKTRGPLINDVARALGVSADRVSRWVGRARSEAEPFQVHEDADLLDTDERRVVNELIRLMALPKKLAPSVDEEPEMDLGEQLKSIAASKRRREQDAEAAKFGQSEIG